ncbi:MAG: hypothetical protein U0Q21_15265 [Dermatophilaceae bacterium]
MTAITIRRLPEDAKRRLRLLAAAKGTSMEAEARAILLAGLDAPTSTDLSWIEQLIELGRQAGGVELPQPYDPPAAVADFSDR